jgi:non-ribosomal peptide synthetase component F
MDVNIEDAQFDLAASITEIPEGLQVKLIYNTDLYDHPTISPLLGHYEMLLRAIVADPHQRLSRLPLLPPAERHQLLVE